jgi:hypothetical protein
MTVVAAHLVNHKLVEFNAQNLSNVAYAFALLHVRDEALFGRLSIDVSNRDLSTFNAQDVSNLVWSFASLDVRAAGLFDKMAASLCRRGLGDLTEQAIANVVWSFATLGVKHAAFFDGVARECTRRDLTTFNAQDVSNLCWSFATLDVSAVDLFDKVAASISKRGLADFVAQNLSILAWSFATAQVHAPLLTGALVEEVLARDLESFNSQALANLAWSMATLGVFLPSFTGKLARECAQRPASAFPAQNVCNVTWAFACAGMLQDVDARAWLDRADHFDIDRSNTSHARQLFYAATAWRIECDKAPLPPLLQRAMEGDWVLSLVDTIRRDEFASSRTHLDIARAFESLGCRCQNEVLTAHGLGVDILVTTPDGQEQVHVEVDGPTHFLQDGVTPTGRTLFKHRLLTKSVPRFASIRVKDWDKMSTEHRTALLRSIME